VAVCWADAASVVARAFGSLHINSSLPSHAERRGRATTIWLAAMATVLLSLGIGATLYLQIRDYLLIPPQELTIRYKGGGQWVVLRQVGREIARRATVWERPQLYIWGWQSPLHFYSRLDSPTRHFFVDNLLRDQSDRHHPLIEPRTKEIMATLGRNPPALIFTGYRPFRALQGFLNEHYLPSRRWPGLWIKRDSFGRFEAAR
jgi:hypothetical protein